MDSRKQKSEFLMTLMKLVWVSVVFAFGVQAIYLPVHQASHHLSSPDDSHKHDNHRHDPESSAQGLGCSLCYAKVHLPNISTQNAVAVLEIASDTYSSAPIHAPLLRRSSTPSSARGPPITA